ncbi:hypothetical protein MKC66_19645 [[Clostridium] innocuum]|nr:hypothetical protein [[Clostridium] innocuum]
MRTINSIKNIAFSLLLSVTTLIFGFIAQSFFIKTLGIEYTGLNGVFTSIISVLSIAELGIGSAIIYHLYKPIYENNIEEIKILMHFYKKAYRLIALVVFVLGIVILPFITFFVEASLIKENIYILFLLYIIDASSSYLLAYKRSIIYANQKNRIIDLVHLLYVILLNSLQIIILIYTQNFLFYLFLKIVFRVLENLIISKIANNLYSFLKENENIGKIKVQTRNEIIKMVKGQLFHQIAGTIVSSTDTMIISTFLSLKFAGIYSNYVMITTAAHTILSQIFTALTASIGNLLVEKNTEKSYFYYRIINHINFMLYSLASIGIFFCINIFIDLWLGSNKFLLPKLWVLFFSFNFFLQGMRKTIQVFAIAAGICYENRYVPILESIVNLIASLLLVFNFGMNGVTVGTIISTLVLYLYGFPKYIYAPLFEKQKKQFIKEFFISILKYIVIFIIEFIIISFINQSFTFNPIIQLIVNIGLCTTIFILITTLMDKKEKLNKQIIILIMSNLNK